MDGNIVHFFAGGVGGTVGAIVTCPLEVIKVRMQSSTASFSTAAPITTAYSRSFIVSPSSTTHVNTRQSCTCFHPSSISVPRQKVTILQALRSVVASEGTRGLYRGIVPTLVGVMPSRAIYFSAYHYGQEIFGEMFSNPQLIFLCSAGMGGFIASTLTNPIWFIKTRLQLDQKIGDKSLTIFRCMKNTYNKGGFLGFYKGVQASYFGISETALHFVIYETLKAHLLEFSHCDDSTESSTAAHHLNRSSDIMYAMMASGTSKFIATTVCYPHEVARTRLREEGTKYVGFVQTLRTVLQEEGILAWYRGLTSHYVRQIPNTCLMIGTYEMVVYLASRYGKTCGDYDE